jgi:hypothetical protein
VRVWKGNLRETQGETVLLWRNSLPCCGDPTVNIFCGTLPCGRSAATGFLYRGLILVSELSQSYHRVFLAASFEFPSDLPVTSLGPRSGISSASVTMDKSAPQILFVFVVSIGTVSVLAGDDFIKTLLSLLLFSRTWKPLSHACSQELSCALHSVVRKSLSVALAPRTFLGCSLHFLPPPPWYRLSVSGGALPWFCKARVFGDRSCDCNAVVLPILAGSGSTHGGTSHLAGGLRGRTPSLFIDAFFTVIVCDIVDTASCPWFFLCAWTSFFTMF